MVFGLAVGPLGTASILTGASAGVGRAAARAFARQGAHIGLLARGHDGLEGARREVESLGGNALVLPTDVAAADQVEAAAAAVEATFGPIDIWINNAMVSVFSPVKAMTPNRRMSPPTQSVLITSGSQCPAITGPTVTSTAGRTSGAPSCGPPRIAAGSP